MTSEVVLLVESYGRRVAGKHVEVDGLHVGTLAGGKVRDKALEQRCG